MGIALLLISSSNANAGNYTSQYSASSDPSYSIMEAVTKIKNFSSNANDAPPALVRRFIEKEIIPLFDFDTMARWITGPYVNT